MKQVFFSTLQLTSNIRQFRKFNLKMLKNHQDFAFFVDTYKFENLKELTLEIYFLYPLYMFLFLIYAM